MIKYNHKTRNVKRETLYESSLCFKFTQLNNFGFAKIKIQGILFNRVNVSSFMEHRGSIKYIVIIVIILAVVFLSQRAYFSPFGEKLNSWLGEQVNTQWVKTKDWFSIYIYPRVSKEVEKRGEEVKEEVQKQKDIAVQSIWEKIKNYFAEKFSKLSGTKVE